MQEISRLVMIKKYKLVSNKKGEFFLYSRNFLRLEAKEIVCYYLLFAFLIISIIGIIIYWVGNSYEFEYYNPFRWVLEGTYKLEQDAYQKMEELKSARKTDIEDTRYFD